MVVLTQREKLEMEETFRQGAGGGRRRCEAWAGAEGEVPRLTAGRERAEGEARVPLSGDCVQPTLFFR